MNTHCYKQQFLPRTTGYLYHNNFAEKKKKLSPTVDSVLCELLLSFLLQDSVPHPEWAACPCLSWDVLYYRDQ